MDDDNDGLVEDEVEQTVFKTGRVAAPGFVSSIIGDSITFIESYGWFILIGAVVLYILYNRFRNRNNNSASQSYQTQKEHSPYSEDVALKRMMEIEEARKRQQAAMDAAISKYLEEKKAKEQKKIEEKIEDYTLLQEGKSKLNKDDGHPPSTDTTPKTNHTGDSKPKPKLRPNDYNPLTGSSSGACYRPAKRGGNRGG